jgi:hypothetical protein
MGISWWGREARNKPADGARAMLGVRELRATMFGADAKVRMSLECGHVIGLK